jgi:hypothetical protein
MILERDKQPTSPHDRYKRDPAFRTLVDTLYMQIHDANFTPTEIREAAMLAQILYEERVLRPIVMDTIR